MTETISRSQERSRPVYRWKAIGLFCFLLGVCYLYAFTNPEPQKVFDYQFRIATAMLHGQLGLPEGISWLNELVPFEGKFYSVFPFGSVLCHVPVAVVQMWRQSDQFPARETVALVVGQIALFLCVLSGRYKDSMARRALLVCWLLFGSWAWSNMAMGNAWQIALAMAMLGQFGALALTLTRRTPWLAGLYFAVAFGNRTEILLTAPLFFYLLLRYDPWRDGKADGSAESDPVPFLLRLKQGWPILAQFCIFPLLLGLATLWYNNARFHNPLDFGYARIPDVLHEYWYQHGIFSLNAVPMNVREMLLSSSWNASAEWPYLKPERMGGSIISACPFLLCLLLPGGRDRVLRRIGWIALTILIVPLWTHGNSGGSQFSYRYAMVLLPWIWMLLMDRRGGKVSPKEWALLALSVLLNGWACYLCFWTKVVFG